MYSENNKTSYPNKLRFNLEDNINLKRSDKYVALSNLFIYFTWKNKKIRTSTLNPRSAPTWDEKIWIILWIKLCIRYSRLFWINHQKT